ncbi:hypothetical protein HY385_00230 [Candidatus Daviesbacteria bacterium]|nr:hypothetical protein [Candidatus Daviesbacteria bacterium]
MPEQIKEDNIVKEQETPIRERVKTAKKIFTVEVRKNKNSRYITLPKIVVDKYHMEPGDQIELAFLGFEFIAADEKSDVAKRKKQKMTMYSS